MCIRDSSETFNPATGTNDNTDETLSKENIFAIQGSYYARLAEGNVYETNPTTGDSGYGTVQSLNTNAIMEYLSLIHILMKADSCVKDQESVKSGHASVA